MVVVVVGDGGPVLVEEPAAAVALPHGLEHEAVASAAGVAIQMASTSLVALVEAKSGDRPTSALVIAKGESGLYSLLAFHPVTDLVMVVAANAAEFIMAAWEAHGCPATEEQALAASRSLAAGAKG